MMPYLFHEFISCCDQWPSNLRFSKIDPLWQFATVTCKSQLSHSDHAQLGSQQCQPTFVGAQENGDIGQQQAPDD